MEFKNIGPGDMIKFRKQPDSFTEDIGKRFDEPEWEEISAEEIANEWISTTRNLVSKPALFNFIVLSNASS